mmetsp:Transcript_91241/g.221555  ORF Transcript_91241/g.221555 Transcript_91241/m.221555 type:complete len:204 (+) Transcript_91241:487-1098(+)
MGEAGSPTSETKDAASGSATYECRRLSRSSGMGGGGLRLRTLKLRWPRLRRLSLSLEADLSMASPSRSARDIVRNSWPLAAFCGVGLAKMRRLSWPGDCGACSASASGGSSFARRFRKLQQSSMMTFLTRAWTSIGSGFASSAASAPVAAGSAEAIMAAKVFTSCGSNSMRWKIACSGFFSSASSPGTSSVTRHRSRTSASMT